jgi:hypothetical protein
MDRVEFFGLERPIQERFIESTRGTGAPAPVLLELPGPNVRALSWAGAGVLLLLACIAFARLGYGNLEHPLALTPAWGLAVFIGLLTVSAGCGLRAFALFGTDRSLPFQRGIYAFPSTAIDARSAALLLYPLSNLADVAVRGKTVELRFTDGAALRFRGVDPARAEEVKGQLLAFRERVSIPPSERGTRDMGLLDPLFDTGFRNPFSPPDRMRPQVERWYRFLPLIALAIGAALGYGVWTLRNGWSAARLYAEACRLDTTHAYQKYLERGGLETDVKDIRLPRAELRDAVARKSVAAVERYIETHPGSKIEQEIQAALRGELLRELGEAQSKATLTALREFKKAQARFELVAGEIAAAERALLRKALDAFVAGAPPNNHEVGPFFARLLTYAEKHGPKVELRFRRRLPESSLKAELAIQKSAYYAGPASLPVQFFDAKHYEPREATVAGEIAARFEKVFPRDMLSVEPAPALEDDGSEIPKVTVPTLVITHRSDLSGAFMSRNPRGTFVGVGLSIRAHWIIPDDGEPLAYKFTVWLPADLKRFEEGNVSAGDIYDGMAREALRRFTKKYLATFFAEP